MNKEQTPIERTLLRIRQKYLILFYILMIIVCMLIIIPCIRHLSQPNDGYPDYVIEYRKKRGYYE